MQKYQDIKEEFERNGYKISDAEFFCMVEYARRKVRASGKDEKYLPLLLPDVIREYFFRAAVSTASVLCMEGEIQIKEVQHNE